MAAPARTASQTRTPAGGQAGSLRVREAEASAGRATQIAQSARMGTQAGPGGRRQRQGLQARQSTGHDVLPEPVDGGVDHQPRVGAQRQRGHELGDVTGDGVVVCSRLRVAEVHDPRVAGGVVEHVGGDEIAVGDVRLAELRDLRPDATEQRPGQLLGWKFLQRPAVDAFLHHQGPAVRAAGQQHGGYPHPTLPGGHGGDGLVGRLPPQRRQRTKVLHVPDDEQAGSPIQPVAVQGIGVEHLDEQRPATRTGGDERVRAAGGNPRRPQLSGRQSEPVQQVGDMRRSGLPAWDPEGVVHQRAGDPTHQQAADDVQRQVRPDVDASEADRQCQRPRHAPEPAGQVRRCRGRQGGGHGGVPGHEAVHAQDSLVQDRADR